MFSVYPIPSWWLREYIALSYYHHQIESMNYYPLFKVRSWNNGMRCMSLYILMKLWYGRIASWDIRVLVVYLPRIWSPVTDIMDMQHFTMLCTLLTIDTPLTRKNNVQGVTRFSTWAKRGGIWTDARVCLYYWVVIWVCTVFGVCHGQDTYGLKVVFCFRHFTASHYHHYARVLTGIENL